jgi:mono/diheme cytochrome c family protein
MVNQSRLALLKRLHEGGLDMPLFHHLSAGEIRSLVVYLQQLAGVPGAEEAQVAIQESHARVGELIVKSTCHICHSATGVNPTPAELSEGAIPPLSALPERVNEQQLVRKVTSGTPVISGTTLSVLRGRMPVFSYLSENEAADVYEYLIAYPPTELAASDHAVQAALLGPANPPADYRGERATSPQPTFSQASVPREQYVSVVLPIVLPISVGFFAAALILLGCWITWREFRRLSVESQARIASRRPRLEPAPWVALRPPVELFIGSSRLRTDRETSHKAG